MNYKVLDVEDLTRHLRSWLEIERLKLPQEGEQTLLESHECTKNHVGSSLSLEIVGVKILFGRSIDIRKLRITGYIGDDDTKTYDIISEE